MTNIPDTLPSTIFDQLRSRTNFLTGSEVMALIGVSRNALCKWVRAGLIPAVRIGKDNRFDPIQLAIWITAHQM